MKKAQGFTLVELIIVIVILGILAVTAAPKFIDIQGDARTSVRTGVVGAVKSALNIGHTKAILAGTTDGEVSMSGKLVNVVKAYPSVVADAAADGSAGKAYGLDFLLDLDISSSVTGSVLTIEISSDCTVTVTDTADENTPPAVAGLTTCS